VKEKGYGVYLSTVQNLRITGLSEEDLPGVKAALQAVGAEIKAPGRFPKPKVCVGKPYCNLGLVDLAALADHIRERFGDRTEVKPKFKIAMAACPASCSNALLADIGVIATRSGYDIYSGGKGGTRPRVGVRIVRGADEERVLEAIEQLVDFHHRKTGKKQRMFKLLEDPEFPFAASEGTAV
jgi:NAD(P)H-nitrite reductase large subunit